MADVIIANSSLTARSHIKAGADPAKIFSVPLAAPPAVAEGELRPRSTTAPLTVVWAGPFSLRKGAHYLLSAWKKLAPRGAAHLHVYGRLTLPHRLKALDETDITFHGSIPRQDLYAAYLEADVLVFPTLSDGFGMVLSEALAHGLPVITTDQAGAADLMTPDNGMIVPAADPIALADAMRWCLDNRQRLLEMRLAALESARRRQWHDFRSDLLAALYKGVRRRGYSPNHYQRPCDRI